LARAAQPVDVLYFIEHRARELDIACTVTALLQSEYKLSVQLASIAINRASTLERFRPKVVVLPYCTWIKDMGLEQIVGHWPNAKYIDLAFEQVLGQTQKAFKAPRDVFARQHVVHGAWGKFFAEYLKESGVVGRNVVVIGNPSLALYRPPYRQYFDQQREALADCYGLDIEMRWVFIPENYGWAFFNDKLLRERIRRGFNRQHAYQYRQFALQSLRAAAEWWARAAQEERAEIIVRPRPAIPKESFVAQVTEAVEDIPPSLHFIKEGTVREWILASEVVHSSYSTTLLEAAVAHKPIYMLAPLPFPDFLHADWYALVDQIESYADFAASIDSQDHNNWEALEGWVNQTMLAEGDAIENIAALIASVARGERELPSPVAIGRQARRPTALKLYRRIRRSGGRIVRAILRTVGITALEYRWDAHEKDRLDQADIEARVARWEKLLGL